MAKRQITLNFVSKGLAQNTAQIKALTKAMLDVVLVSQRSARTMSGSAGNYDAMARAVNRVALSSNKAILSLRQMYGVMERGGASSANKTVGMGAMMYSLYAISDKMLSISGQMVNFGKSAVSAFTGIAFSFEYIKAGLDFAFGYKSQDVMQRALDVAQQTNISTREVLDVTRSLGVLKIDPFSDMMNKKGQVQTALQSMSDLAALVPQQGMEGALFAIRNALSGQWRSLQMRFDIPLNIIEDIRKNIVSTMSTQQRFDVIMQGITNHFGGLMASVQNTSKFAIDNIKDIFTNLMYDISKEMSPILTPFFVKIEMYLIGLRKNRKFISDLGAVVKTLSSAFVTLGNIVFKLFITLGTNAGWLKFVLGATAVITAVAGMTGLIGKGVLMWQSYSLAMQTAAGASRVLTVSMTAMKWAMFASGILTAVAVLGTLAAYFLRAKEAGKQLKDVLQGMSTEEATAGSVVMETSLRGVEAAGKQYYGKSTTNVSATEIETRRNNMLWSVSKGLLMAQKAGGQAIPQELMDAFGTLDKSTGEVSGINTNFSLQYPGEKGKALLEQAKAVMKRGRDEMVAKTGSTEAVRTGGMVFGGRYKNLVSMQATEQAMRLQASKDIIKETNNTLTPQAALSIVDAMGNAYKGQRPGSNDVYSIANSMLAGQGAKSTAQKSFPTSATLSVLKGHGITAEKLMGMTSGYSKYTVNPLAGANYYKTELGGIASDVIDKYKQGLYTEELGTAMKRLKFPGIGPSSTAEAMKASIESAYDRKGGIKQVEELLKVLGADTKDVVQNTEDTAKNTKKVEELLPPIFREIFDKFTRRGMLAGQGRAAFLGVR